MTVIIMEKNNINIPTSLHTYVLTIYVKKKKLKVLWYKYFQVSSLIYETIKSQ